MDTPEVNAFIEYLDWYLDGTQSGTISLSDFKQLDEIANTFEKHSNALPEYNGPSAKVKQVDDYCHAVALASALETHYLALSVYDEKTGDAQGALDSLDKAKMYSQESTTALKALGDLVSEIRGERS